MGAGRTEQVQGKKPSNQCGVSLQNSLSPYLPPAGTPARFLPLPDGDFHYFRAVKTTKDDFESFSISDLELLEKQ